MKTVKTFTATIYVGLREGRTADPSPKMHTIDDVRVACQVYCNSVGLCVTVTPTEFIYTNGGEPGAIVGIINYPRFPTAEINIMEHAKLLALLLQSRLGQQRVTIVCPETTVMFSNHTEEA
jgi:Fe-S-cluster-containing hydrogenase component 2